MNATENQTPSLPASPSAKWRCRHPKAHFYLTSLFFALVGGLAGMFVARGLEAEHRINDWLASGLILSGVQLGCLVCGVDFLVQHFCFPDKKDE